MKPVDCHCHLDFDRFDGDREKVIKRIAEKLEFAVTAGSNPETNESVLKLEEDNPDTVYCNLGLHPVYTESFDEINRVKEQIQENSPIAVGEIGLDHHHIDDKEVRETQEQVFRELLRLAEKLDKPVVVHSRDAERKTFEILKEYDLPEVMLHCFNGSVELAEEAVKKGYHIGVTTQVLYSSHVQQIADQVPLENILLETDSPFLYRGERNEPVNVRESIQKIAEIKSLDAKEAIEITTENAKQFFSLASRTE